MNRRPEGGPGNLSHPANFEIFNKNSYAVWYILDYKFFVIFKQSLSRPLFFYFFYFFIFVPSHKLLVPRC